MPVNLKAEGNAAFRAGDWSEAADKYTHAIAVEPAPESFSNRAACMIHLHNWPAAILDCQSGLEFASVKPHLRVKLSWRLAVASRNAGESRSEWESAVAQGLKLDPANDKLREEQVYIFVEKTVPPEFMPEPQMPEPTQTSAKPASTSESQPAILESQSATSESRSAISESQPAIFESQPAASESKPATSESKPATPESKPEPTSSQMKEFMPSLPITYTGVLQLVRMPGSEAHDFIYANITGPQLKAALARAGVEPLVLDYFFAMISAHPEQRDRNVELLRALESSPRYDSASFMADDKSSARIAQI